MQELIESLKGAFGGALSTLGIPVMIWGLVFIGLGFIEVHNEYKTKGILLFAAGALLASLRAVISAIF